MTQLLIRLPRDRKVCLGIDTPNNKAQTPNLTQIEESSSIRHDIHNSLLFSLRANRQLERGFVLEIRGIHGFPSCPVQRGGRGLPHSGLCGQLSGRGTATAEDAQGTPTQSHVSPSILVYEEQICRASYTASTTPFSSRCAPTGRWSADTSSRSEVHTLPPSRSEVYTLPQQSPPPWALLTITGYFPGSIFCRASYTASTTPCCSRSRT